MHGPKGRRESGQLDALWYCTVPATSEALDSVFYAPRDRDPAG
jgi:hypothetical protein